MPVDRRAYLFALAPTLVVVAVCPALALAIPSPLTVSLGPARLLGLPLVAVGLVLVVLAVLAFARAGEPPSPADQPDELVTRGVLSYTRNPIYLGTVLAALGVAVLFSSVVVAAYAGLLWVVYHLLTVYREEPELRAQFGEEFDAYANEVPRWV